MNSEGKEPTTPFWVSKAFILYIPSYALMFDRINKMDRI
jgi:hypothetical protein